MLRNPECPNCGRPMEKMKKKNLFMTFFLIILVATYEVLALIHGFFAWICRWIHYAMGKMYAFIDENV